MSLLRSVFLMSLIASSVACFCLHLPAHCAEQPDTISVKDTAPFFQWFIRNQLNMPKKDEFETDEQYTKRLPPAFNSNKVIYFVVKSWYEHSYDISEQKLTVRAGKWMPCGPLTTEFKMEILEKQQSLGEYTGTNAFGVTARVRKSRIDDYYLLFEDLDLASKSRNCAEYFDLDTNRFRMCIAKPPDEAKKLCEYLELVVGVTLQGFWSGGLRCWTSKPTMDQPYEFEYSEYTIRAHLVKVLLVDRRTWVPLAECIAK